MPEAACGSYQNADGGVYLSQLCLLCRPPLPIGDDQGGGGGLKLDWHTVKALDRRTWRRNSSMLLRSHAANSLAELILKTADQGHTTYEDLLAAASDQIQVIASIIT